MNIRKRKYLVGRINQNYQLPYNIFNNDRQLIIHINLRELFADLLQYKDVKNPSFCKTNNCSRIFANTSQKYCVFYLHIININKKTTHLPSHTKTYSLLPFQMFYCRNNEPIHDCEVKVKFLKLIKN